MAIRIEAAAPKDRLLQILLALALIVLIALCDWRITAPVPLGFLYLAPMFILGRTLGPWFIVLAAALCTALAEFYDGFPLTFPVGFSRLLLYFSAFVTTGQLVRELNQNRLRALEHLDEIKRQRDALREAESQLEALIESSPAAILTADGSGQILMANEAAHQLFGAAAGTLTRRRIQDYLPSLANLDSGHSSRPRFRAVMQSRGFREDHEVFLADICFSTYPTGTGNRLTAMVTDTSESLRDHEESSLKQLMTGSRLVAGALSHEIRNVCAAIAVVHQNLLVSGLLKGNQDFEALGGLTRTLQDLAAIELGYAAPQSTPIDLAETLNDLRVVLTPTLQEESIAINWGFDERLPSVWGDRSQLMQIFMNLANNSVRALREVDAPRLSVAAVCRDHRVFVEFEDNGGGVQQPERLFQPFQKGARSSGLGLFLSRAFARSAGGNLTYMPRPGGSCFVLELVVAAAAEPTHG